MNERSDQDLLREYARRGSEGAFAALTRRHTSLVYGTAMRTLNDVSLAEEITQSVFIILARKAPFLCHVANLSGWLHQTALLESRHRIRTELRRKRREDIAMEFNQPQHELHSDLSRDIDEALLDLAEKDRQPLLLRFFESLSLREVGSRLGIGEDAAQKRVAKSLGLLGSILCKRGREIGTTALAALLAEYALSAPPALAATVAHGAIAVGGAATGIGLAFGKFMALSKTQLAAACLLAIGAPLLFQAQKWQEIRNEKQQLASDLAVEGDRSAAYAETIRRLNSDIAVLQFDRQAILNGAKQRNALAAPQNILNAAKLYRWLESSPYVRLPKDILESIRLTSAKQSDFEKRYGLPAASTGAATNDIPREIARVNPIDSKGAISEALAEGLGLTQNERAEVSASIQHLAAEFDAAAAQHTIVTNSMPPGIDFSVPKDGNLVTLWTQAFPEQGAELKQQLSTEIEYELGAERAKIVLRQASLVFDSDFLAFGAREQWLAAAPQSDGMVTIGRAVSAKEGSQGGSVFTVSADSVPAELRAHLPQSLFAKHE